MALVQLDYILTPFLLDPNHIRGVIQVVSAAEVVLQSSLVVVMLLLLHAIEYSIFWKILKILLLKWRFFIFLKFTHLIKRVE